MSFGAALVLTGCGDTEQVRGETAAPTELTSSEAAGACEVVATELGKLTLCASGEAHRDEWRELVRRSTRQVAAMWGSTGASSGSGSSVSASTLASDAGAPAVPLRVTVCADDADFNSVADGLALNTGGVTTTAGVFLAPSVTTSLTRQGRGVILTHELVHAVLGHVGSDPTALWVREGAAQWTAERGLTMPRAKLWPTLASIAQPPTGPPMPQDFETNSSLAYETASAYVTFLADHSSVRQVVAFVRARPSGERAEVAALELVRGTAASFDTWLSTQLH